MTDDPGPFDSLRTYADTLGAARFLAARYDRGHAAALLDRGGRVLDVNVFASPTHKIDDALHWAHATIFTTTGVHQVALFTVGVAYGDRLAGADLERLVIAYSMFEPYGIRVVDWIQVDQTGAVRSTARLAEAATDEPATTGTTGRTGQADTTPSGDEDD